MSENEWTKSDEAFEGALGQLQPRGPAIDRDALMFEAGRASVRRRMRLWQGAAAILLAALGASLAFDTRPAPPPVERVIRVVVKEPVPVPATTPALDRERAPAPAIVTPAASPRVTVAAAEARSGLLSYIQLRDSVLRYGIDVLPLAPPARTEDMDDLRDLRKSLYPWLQSGRPFSSRGALPGEPT